MRRLSTEDLAAGFLESLDSLREASGMGPEKAKDILSRISANPDHIVLVAEYGGRIVGATTLLIEPKFIHGGGIAGHIEDVAVARGMQGKGIGKLLVREALECAKKAGCYKTILDCEDSLLPFYEGLGFRRGANAMRFDH
ncbi:histone acetyltransferase [Cenarchaeum symbiosum A]|uniref:glucosamine-phosphate N-acetyltransferase n=1 Tax=Cenarchaeum symbiosum (strain A) TaxID=414004 RepID=A0RUQ2_CENSY|nr:histone acetyltransferase [Cenarchaeum symbiosum A]